MSDVPEDDWFPEAAARPSGEVGRPIEDEWFAGDGPRRPSSSFDPWSLVDRRVLLPAAVALAFLLGLLGAAGVFDTSSGSSPAQIPGPILTTTTPTPPGTATTTTAKPRPTAAPPTTTLKPGDSGPQVKALQLELASLGYSVGVADGLYGKATSQAVTAFQRANNLTPDGIVGPATLLALAP